MTYRPDPEYLARREGDYQLAVRAADQLDVDQLPRLIAYLQGRVGDDYTYEPDDGSPTEPATGGAAG